jgi:23S rRNA (cytosine1962-C5)-methyltransferase
MMVLKPGREKSLRRRHPWIFSGAVEKVAGKPGVGDTVEVKDKAGTVWAKAAYSPKSQIRARVWTFDAAEEVDAAFFRNRVMRAVALRESLHASKVGNALRLAAHPLDRA